MIKLPPTPEISLLQIPLPDLGQPGAAAGDSLEARISSVGAEEDRGADAAAIARDQGRFDEALAICRRAQARSVREGMPDVACRVMAIRVSILSLKGDFSAASELVAQLQEIARGGPPRGMAYYHEAAGTTHLRTVMQDQFEHALDHFTRAADLFRESGDTLGQVRCHAGIASAHSGQGMYVSAIEHADTGLKLSAEAGRYRFVNRCLLEAALALRDQGYRQKVDELFKLSIAWSDHVGEKPARIRALNGLAFLYDFEADVGSREDMLRSEQVFLQAISEAEEIGALPLMMQARLDLVHLYNKFGDAEAVSRQRTLATEEAGRLSLSAAPQWFDRQAEYRRWLDEVRSERYYMRLQEAIEGVDDPFFIVDRLEKPGEAKDELLNEFRNTAANQLLGLAPGTVRALADLLPSPFFEGLREPLLQAVNDRQPYADEIRVGDEWYVRKIVAAGQGAVLTLRNCTDAKNVQSALESAAESARQADRMKSEFLANMTHEVRTPINGVLGLARLLADSELSDEQRTYVKGIISSGDVLLRVIGDVLDLSKIEAQSMQVELEPAEVAKIVSEVVSLYRGQARNRGLQLRGMVEVDVPPVVLLDEARVRQILGNLIGNAVKFTDEGAVEVVVRVADSKLEFEVSDTGAGIPSDRLQAIFAPFRQEGNRVQKEGGTGLGLTISKRLAELMGGTITVKSQVGKGSRFVVRLPLRPAAFESAPRARQEEVSLHGARILLVEDNEVNILVATGLLSKLGCLVDTVLDGAAAVEKALTERYDAILMDVQLPVMDGLEATVAIRREEQGRRVPIIALTAGTLSEERDACFAAGVDEYLTKPFTVESLTSALQRCLAPDR